MTMDKLSRSTARTPGNDVTRLGRASPALTWGGISIINVETRPSEVEVHWEVADVTGLSDLSGEINVSNGVGTQRETFSFNFSGSDPGGTRSGSDTFTFNISSTTDVLVTALTFDPEVTQDQQWVSVPVEDEVEEGTFISNCTMSPSTGSVSPGEFVSTEVAIRNTGDTDEEVGVEFTVRNPGDAVGLTFQTFPSVTVEAESLPLVPPPTELSADFNPSNYGFEPDDHLRVDVEFI